MKAKPSVACLVAALFLSVAGYAGAAPPAQGERADPAKAQITVLYDAFGKPSAMQKDWGYSALIEYGGKRILFDTGNNPNILAKNAKAKGIDLSKLDFVVMSHRHGDHMGGLTYLLSVNPKVTIYAPKEGFGVYGADLPSSFYRKDESLPPERRYYDGKPPDVMRFGAAWPGTNFQLVDKSIEVAPGIHLIALVSDKPGTLELRELSLAINGPDGLIIVVGCSHPGIDKILETATAINPRVHLVAGGFHLVVSKDPDIEQIVSSLRDTYKVEYVAPGHCTGEPTFTALKKAFSDRYLYAGLGTTLTLGATPKAIAEAEQKAATTMSEDDLKSYHSLRANTDDHEPARLALRSYWAMSLLEFRSCLKGGAMRLDKLGAGTFQVEIADISKHGFWIFLGNQEIFAAFKDFPWFESAPVAKILRVERPSPDHLYWPELDVDLSVESLLHPERFPLLPRA